MKDYVLFTGAGASKPLGYPTTVDFLDMIPDSPIVKSAREFLKEKLGRYDVEHIVTLFETIDKFFDTDAGEFISKRLPADYQKSNFQKIYRDLKRLFLEVYSKLPDLKKLETAYMPLLEYLGYRENKIHWFTTNYDPTADYLCYEKLKDYYINGFPGGVWDESEFNSTESGVYVYFLHGCIGMHLRKDDNRVVLNRSYDRHMVLDRNLIIYPGLIKGDKSYGIFEFYYNALRDRLKKAELVIVIGFSFRDQEIKDIFERAFGENPELKLVVVDPNIEKPDKLPEGSNLPELKKRLGKRCITIPKPFGDGKSLVEEIKKVFGEDKSLARKVIEKFE